jgi:hypothetical protein
VKEELIKQLTPVLISFIVSVITIVITTVGVVLRNYFKIKSDEVMHKLSQSQHEAEVKTALEVWHIVDEHFRVKDAIGDTIQLKIDMFNDLLLQKIPGLKQADIDYLRQTVAGEVNKFKEILKTDTL